MRTADKLRVLLVGIDGSPGGERALTWAGSRGLETGAEILAVHVLTYNREFNTDLSISGLTSWRRSLRRSIEGPWTESGRASGCRLKACLVENDSAAAGLLSVADARHVDLIVLGTHGHGGVADRLLGGTTYRVAHQASVPVVIVPVDWTHTP